MLGESDEFRKLHRAIEKGARDIHETIEATCGICLGAKSGSTWRPLGSTNGSYKYAGPRAKSHFGAPEIADWWVTLGGSLEMPRRGTLRLTSLADSLGRHVRV
jgi:hypothetical protein